MNRRQEDLHPAWCGRGHVCSADRPGGEHRSHPLSVDTAAGRLVATRIRTTAGADRLELRAVLDLPADPPAARHLARLLLARVHQAIRPASPAGGRR
jgi:hypothetical protein